MGRKRDPHEGGRPLFWLLLGFFCGVMATLGLLLLFSSKVTGDADAIVAPPVISVPIEPPALDGAPPPGGPVVLIPPPVVEPATPIQEPVVRPTLPAFRPKAQAAPPRSDADQMAEDAAASGMTARTR